MVRIFTSLLLLLSTAYPGRADFLAMKERVQSIGERVSQAAGADIRVKVLPEEAEEAYVYPDGLIVLTEGLVRTAGCDDEIAFVIGHEIAHLEKRHHGDGVVLRIMDDLSIDREEEVVREIEADIEGMRYLRMAGYNPFLAVRLLTRLPYNPSLGFEKRIVVIMNYLVDYP